MKKILNYSLAEKIFSLKNLQTEDGKWYKIINIFGIRFKRKKRICTIEKNIDFIQKVLTKNYLKSKFEKERCIDFYREMQTFDKLDKYNRLIQNLDEESITQVSTILGRLTKIANSETTLFDIFSPSEIELIQKARKDLESNCVKLSDNCFAYKQFLLPINHFEASVFYYKHNIDVLKNITRFKNKAIIDVGGYIGDSAIVLEKYTNNRVYSFEPTTENYNLLLKTIELNKSSKIVAYKMALGSKEEELEIYLQSSGSSINRVIHEAPSKEKIQVSSLDKFVKENNIEVGLIKVDIEGFEQEFLKGAEMTIKTQRPTLLISIYHNASDFFDIKPILESWNLGYKFKITRPNDGGIRGETLLIAE